MSSEGPKVCSARERPRDWVLAELGQFDYDVFNPYGDQDVFG